MWISTKKRKKDDKGKVINLMNRIIFTKKKEANLKRAYKLRFK